LPLSFSKIDVLIVDDEYSGRAAVKIILQEKAVELINKITTSTNLYDARNKVSSNDYQLVFLDIELGNHSGFELLPFLHANTKVIFVTAYSEFAIQAIKKKAFDYILKPISPTELMGTINRYQKEILCNQDKNTYLIIKESGKSIRIKIDDIEYIKGGGPYSFIYTTNGDQRTTSKTLKTIHELVGERFLRIHKSYLINTEMIQTFTNNYLTTKFNTCLPVTLVGLKDYLQ
jgi:two-component system LytT family response regulator